MEENNQENIRPESLTCIHSPYTISDTHNEVERLTIKNFLNTLAEIALAIASKEALNK